MIEERVSADKIILYLILHIINRIDYIESTYLNTQGLERMKHKNKYQEPRDYTPGWTLDALRIESHNKVLM